ncbi:histidine phosphatase family protein [Kineosporia succinea]|uniref:Phosphoglycerate mutase n=1 Tax=Kineosporia succinea TaxID=84632 RepID=A0ABT9PBS0_9ACTN|nr:histidine phosphatase family protein [Kineosporia succinea]MDP9829937.1 putative phosphoglycerate mutase [Kineosporia succinea]
MPSTTLYLVRHGEQSPEGAGLSAAGRAQATSLGRRLTGTRFDAVHHSCLPRAVQTTQIVTPFLPGVPVHECDLVKDRTPVPDSYPARYRDFFAAVPEDERDPGPAVLREAVEHLGAVGERDRTDLVVTHNFVIGWFVRHVLDAPDWRWLGLNQANCGVTIVRWETSRPAALICFNDVGHL